MIMEATGIAREKAERMHFEMCACVHGIATMFATGFLDLEWDLVDQMMSDAYLSLKKRYETE